MKKLAILIVLPLFAFVSADWFTLKMDERISIDFPAEPVKKEITGRTAWQHDIGTDCRCVALTFDFKEFGMDSIQLAEEMLKPTALEEFGTGALGKMGEGSSMVSQTKGLTAGKTSFDFVFTLGSKDTSDFTKLYNKNIFAGTKMYVLYFYEKPGNPQDAIRNRFLNSVKLK